MSKKLAAKASLIHLPPLMDTVPAAGERGDRLEPADRQERPVRGDRADRADRPPVLESRAKTAPGSMAIFMASQSAAVKEAEELREKLSAFDGAQPVRRLDPHSVRPSRWANRHEHSFADAAFAELKADIAAAGGNIQPVCVRALPGVLNGSTRQYELVYGHRRHRACLELGLPVQALITDISDQALFETMERENRSRKNLSAWEQGTMYRRALDEGLYPSQRRLAEALGVDVSLVSKSLSLARLPEAVVAAFASPLDIQFRWAQPLAEALQKDPEGVLTRATRLRKTGGAGTPAQVLAALVGTGSDTSQGRGANDLAPLEKRLGAGGGQVQWQRDARGALTLRFPAGALDATAQAEMEAFVIQLLARAQTRP